MRTLIFLLLAVLVSPVRIRAQADPDSLFLEWLTGQDWMDVTASPDIAAEWLADLDTLRFFNDTLGNRVGQLLTMNVPSGARIFDWRSDSGERVMPVSLKYRIRIRGGRRWECRLQANGSAGDTCFRLPDSGPPRGISCGFRIRPGNLLREVLAGDYQVSTGFGVVAGTTPVFGTALGDPAPLARSGGGLRLHSGNTAAPFLRGVAAILPMGASELTLFGSGRHASGEGAAGVAWKRTFAAAETGFTIAGFGRQDPPEPKTDWNGGLQPDSGRFLRIGAWGRFRMPFGLLFGEGGWSPSGGYAWTGGVRLFETHGFSAVLKTTGCSAGYPVPYSIFQSGSGQIREGRSFVAAFRYALGGRLDWTGSGEVKSATWPGNSTLFGKGTTRMIHQLRFLSGNLWQATGSIQVDFREPDNQRPQKLTWKLSFDSDPKRSGTFRLRAGIRRQMQGFTGKRQCGTTADCSLSVSLAGNDILLTAGFRVFSTETGADPLYAYEPDVRYGFSAPVLSGSGSRFFLTGRCRVSDCMDLEIKVARSVYTDARHLTEGNAGGWSGKVQLIVGR